MSGRDQTAASRVAAVFELVEYIICYLEDDDSWLYDPAQYAKRMHDLYATSLVSRLFYKTSKPRLYHSIMQTALSRKSAKHLGGTLTRNLHLADLVRHISIDGELDGCIVCLHPLFRLEHLSIVLAFTPNYLQMSVLDNVTFALNAGSVLKKLTLRFNPLEPPEEPMECERSVGKLVNELPALTHLHLFDPHTIEVVESAIVGLPQPAGLAILEITEVDSERYPLFEADRGLWSEFLPLLLNLGELHLQGRVCHQVLDTFPTTLKHLSFHECDAALAHELLLRLADPNWLPLLHEMPAFDVEIAETSTDCYTKHSLAVPPESKMKATIKAAIKGIESRKAWSVSEENLKSIRAIDTKLLMPVSW